MLNGSLYIGANTTAANIGSDFQQLGTQTSISPARIMLSMVQQYREYRYHKVTVQWIPSIGPNSVDAGGRVFLAYTDNPEQGSNFQLGNAPLDTTAKKVAFVKGCRNFVAYNAWERFTWNVPLTRRRPWFDVNTTDAGSDINMYDRAVQGMIVQAYESVSAAVVLGTLRVNFTLELRGLNIDASAVV